MDKKYVKAKGISAVPTRNGKLIHLPLDIIIEHYSSILSGLLNYYAFASNFTRVKARLYYLLKYSCA